MILGKDLTEGIALLLLEGSESLLAIVVLVLVEVVVLACWCLEYFTATLLHKAPILLSSYLTPASLVYALMTRSNALSSMEIIPGFIPFSEIYLGIKYFTAISCFSSVVYPGILITSMRSNSGPWIVSSWFAVAMNITSERSNGKDR